MTLDFLFWAVFIVWAIYVFFVGARLRAPTPGGSPASAVYLLGGNVLFVMALLAIVGWHVFKAPINT